MLYFCPFRANVVWNIANPRRMPLGYVRDGLSARLDVCEYCNFKAMLNL